MRADSDVSAPPDDDNRPNSRAPVSRGVDDRHRHSNHRGRQGTDGYYDDGYSRRPGDRYKDYDYDNRHGNRDGWNDGRDMRDVRNRDHRDLRDVRDLRDRESRDLRDRDSREARDVRDRDARDYKVRLLTTKKFFNFGIKKK